MTTARLCIETHRFPDELVPQVVELRRLFSQTIELFDKATNPLMTRPQATPGGFGRKVNNQGRSMGMALTSCTVPAAGKPTFELGDDEMEIGIGIHGEPGRRRVKLAPASEITEMLATPVIEDLGLKAGERVLAFVNGMGGTPLIELYVVANELAKILRGRDITIARSLIGSYITSLEMAGCSITLLRLDDELTRYWDAPVHTPALRWGV